MDGWITYVSNTLIFMRAVFLFYAPCSSLLVLRSAGIRFSLFQIIIILSLSVIIISLLLLFLLNNNILFLLNKR